MIAFLKARPSGDPFVIQEYVDAAVAGATLCTPDGVLTEGVAGPAAPLLRGGVAGAVVASHNAGISWRIDRDGLDLEAAHASVPTRPGALWEWIVDGSGRIFHVDRKELSVPLLGCVPRDGPPDAWHLGASTSGSLVELPDTSIAGLDRLAGRCRLHIARGSPVAHLCYEAVTRGCSIVLDRHDRPHRAPDTAPPRAGEPAQPGSASRCRTDRVRASE